MIFDNIIFKNRVNLFLSTLLVALTLGLARRIHKLFANKKGRIVIISLHKLGDSVFTIPTILNIQKHFNRPITIVCFKESVPIYEIKCSSIDFLILNRDDFFFRKRIANLNAKEKLKLLKPEIIIDLTGEMTSTSLIYSSSAKQILGLTKKHFSPVYDKSVDIEYKKHITEQYFNVLSLLDSNLTMNYLNNEEFRYFPIKTICVHPFAGWRAKEWSFNKFVLLSIELNKSYKVKIIIPSNQISHDIIHAIEQTGIEIIFTETVEKLISAINECSLLICNDSGPIHIASLLSKYTFSIFGPTNPKVHKPYGLQHGYYFNKIKCSPGDNDKMCFTAGGRVGCPSNECLNLIEVKDMYIAVENFIKKLKLSIFNEN